MDFFEILLHPKERMAQELKKVDVQWAHKQFAVYGAVIGFLLGLFVALLGGIIGAVAGSMAQNNMIFGIIAGLGMLSIIILPIVGAILTVVSSFIFYHIIAFIAKMLGGSGDFTANYFLAAKLLVPLIVANIVITILSAIPVVGWLINIVWMFYTFYLMIVLVSVANNVSMVKAFVVWIIPVILIFVIGMIVAGSLLAGALAASQI